MSVLLDNNAFRKAVVGLGPVSKASGTLASSAISVFTVAGGEVLITSVYLKVTTSITTDSATLALQSVQTTGGTATLVTATDLGTTDTVAGAIIGVDNNGTTLTAPKFLFGGKADLMVPVATGIIKLLPSGGNGAVTIYVTWVPLTDGATLVAA